jgi:murein DD-endopeptidase MepM/ murein hydrolase activator NlpD
MFIMSVMCVFPTRSFSENQVNDLQVKINTTNEQIKALEAEIEQYTLKVNEVGNQKKTLQNTVNVLDVTQKKVSTDLLLTQRKIEKTQFVISSLGSNIATTSDQIVSNKNSVQSLVNTMYQMEHESFIESFLKYNKLSDLWRELDTANTVQTQIRLKSKELAQLKDTLTVQKRSTEQENARLGSLKENLADQKKIVAYTQKEKASLLVQTKNTEAVYKKLVTEKKALKDQFEKDLFDFESQLKIAIDPSLLPTSRSGVLSWPLDKVTITQLFGKTNASARLYVSGSHNGVDFGAPLGTPVKASLSGVVAGTGDTDAYKGCYSFGRWIMITHANGLSTIYGHLSLIKVTAGQTVSTGELIGYSGNTGYSTGPHLHLGVYATQGVRIEKFVNSRGCKDVVLPLADTKAYLDPILYLPSL